MSQGLRDMLANRKFAIPLIVLLGFCLVGLILIGVVLILRPGGGDGEPTAVAGVDLTASPEATIAEPATFTPAPTSTDAPTPRPSATLVPVGTVVEATATGDVSGGQVTSAAPTVTSTAGQVTGGQGTTTPATPGATQATGGQATATGVQPTATTASVPSDSELAQTGVGWGLILFSGAGLAFLAVVARRLRMAGS